MFNLDPQLQADTWVLGNFPLCQLLLSRDANYPWLILVPRRADISEVFELSEEDQTRLAAETARLAAAIKAVLGADKMNVAALGNVVKQLHVHVIARYVADPAWPAPVWGKVAPAVYTPEALEGLKAKLRSLALSEFEWANV